jgi:hypothetical protein
MHREGVKGFATVGEVDDNCADARRIERLQVKVQDPVAAVNEIGNNRLPTLPLPPVNAMRLPINA